MPDIADQLDAAIGVAPHDAPALEPTLALGRRALRRRRMAYGVGATAITTMVGAAVWVLGPAANPIAPDDADLAGQPGEEQFFMPDDDRVATYHPVTGELLVRDGWSILKRVEDPITGPAPSDFASRSIDDSVGLVLTNGKEPGGDQWVLAWWSAEGKGQDRTGVSGTATDPAGEAFDRFGRWLAYQSAILRAEPDSEVSGPQAATFDADAGLVTKPGWKVAERIRDPLGDGSLAVDMTDGDVHQWFIFSRSGIEISDIHPDPAHPGSPDADHRSFADWVDAMVAAKEQPRGEGER